MPHAQHLQAIIDFAKFNASLSHDRPSRVHGIDHWQRVAENGILLQDEGVNPKVVELFAYLHDCCREDDGSDPEHGPRAAKLIRTIRHTLLEDLTDEEFDELQKACRWHTSHDRTNNPTINACFDADRLDLGRVGVIPDPHYMASPKGKELAAKIHDEIFQMFTEQFM